jgi:hypothetical protein
MNRSFVLSVLLAGGLLFSAGTGLARAVPQQQRLRQQVVVNGRTAPGVTVFQNGRMQTLTCSNPQPYTVMNGSTNGWACFDASTGTWLLNAAPPPAANVYVEPPYYYPEEAPYDYDNYGYPYSYDYVPYESYPYGYLGAPLFSFGFGFGNGHEHHEYEEHHGHGHGHGRDGHAEHHHDGGRHK